LFKILQKQILSEKIKLFIIEAPLVAGKARAGQFVIIRIDEMGERIPLTVADSSKPEGTITLIFQELGKTTMQLGLLEPGDSIEDVVGPLGQPSEISNFGTVVVVGGGIGIAPLYPIARELHQAGNKVISIIGARSQDLLFWEDHMRALSDEFILCTDDGSKGRRALVTEPLQEMLAGGAKIDRAWAIGPAIMMKQVSAVTQRYHVPTIVSLNTIMIDGTGMCGGCRVALTGGTKFVCVDGPEFDGHAVNWENLLLRLSYYRAQELQAVERWQKHVCRIRPVDTKVSA
jgi:ferredoxin--NADP+ reductase